MCVRLGTKCRSFIPAADEFYTVLSTDSGGDPKVWMYIPKGKKSCTDNNKSSDDSELELMYHLTAEKHIKRQFLIGTRIAGGNDRIAARCGLVGKVEYMIIVKKQTLD